MPNTSYSSWYWRKHLNRLDILLDFALNGLSEFDISEQCALRFGLEFPVLKFLKSFFGYFSALLWGKELQVLEVVVISFEGPERNIEFDWDIRFQNCTLREYLKNSHILTVEVLPFLSDPRQSQFALHFVGDFDLPLSTHRQNIIVPEIHHVRTDVDQLILLALEKEFLLQDVGVLPDLHVGLVEIFLVGILESPFGQFQQKIVLDVFKLDGRNPSLNNSLPEGVNMLLKQGDGPDQQIIAGTHQIDVQQDMVPHKTVDPFIVGHRVPGPEFYHYLGVAVAGQDSLGVVELKHIRGVGEKLILSAQLWVVGEGQHFGACVVQLYLPEVDGVTVEGDVESSGVALQTQRQGVPRSADHFEVCYYPCINKSRGKCYFHCETGFWREDSLLRGESEELLVELAVPSVTRDAELCGDLGAVLDDEFPGDGLGDEDCSEIELCGVEADVGVLSDCAHFDDPLGFAFNFEDDGANSDGGLPGGELNLKVGVGVGEEDSFGGGDVELGELEDVGEGLDVGVEDGEGVLGGAVHRAETQLVAVRDW